MSHTGAPPDGTPAQRTSQSTFAELAVPLLVLAAPLLFTLSFNPAARPLCVMIGLALTLTRPIAQTWLAPVAARLLIGFKERLLPLSIGPVVSSCAAVASAVLSWRPALVGIRPTLPRCDGDSRTSPWAQDERADAQEHSNCPQRNTDRDLRGWPRSHADRGWFEGLVQLA
jgi:hypothetical protein